MASLAQAGCYTLSAARHTGRLVRSGWDTDRWGPLVVLTAPGALLAAPFDFAVRSFVPTRAAEPRNAWFRFYDGPLRATSEVAILCHRHKATIVHTIRDVERAVTASARYGKWQFPRCIEALPGTYDLDVHYFRRQTDEDDEEITTEHVESTEPSRIRWQAEAGAIYALEAKFGAASPAPGPAPRSRLPKRQRLGTSWFKLEVSEWNVRIERLASWDDLDEPLLEYRAAWDRYERMRP